MTNIDQTATRGTEHALGARVLHAVWAAAGLLFHHLARAYRIRRDIAYLRTLDDEFLNDLGITRGEIEDVVRGR